MDSLTQIVLGAATAEAVVGNKIGNKALLLGAIAGTIPDLDVLASPLLSTAAALEFHRSFSHSIAFAIVGGGIFAYLFWKIFNWKTIGFKALYWVFFLCFLTHILLDTCTTWGTQLLWPFSSYGYALYTIFVVDPFYTVPFLLCVLSILFIKKTNPWRRRINWFGIIWSTSYLILGFVMQHRAGAIFTKNAAAQGIQTEDMITKTTPGNIILWSCSIKTKTGFYSGFYSFFDKEDTIAFEFEPANTNLLDPFRYHREVQTLIRVSKGFYSVEKTNSGVLMNDVRFGKFNGWQGEDKGTYVFKYSIDSLEDGSLQIKENTYRETPDKAYAEAFFNRVLGKK